ncbi:MAG TPA: ATP synthase F1 subunit gamma [Candidatus Angelobacter sp.]|jgi:F-type H+-transporting ATPase subunit gamma|nr:ATP synthase F1 subunit gamma [Candidatus Angelobacter sp.]
MANLLDIRRRIRSVRNTRQITKAMQMVSAAKLRRAQERAFAARPYAQMLTNVLKSLVSRADIYDPETGEVQHPLLIRRPENNVTLIVVSGEKGLAGAFNSNILKAAASFIASKSGKNIDIVAVGKKARDYFRRRYPLASEGGDRKGGIQITGEFAGLINRTQFSSAREISQLVIDSFTRAATDAVYLVYNEFKSVISQRLVVDHVLPVERIGEVVHEVSEEMKEEARKQHLEAAKHAGVGVRAIDTREIDRKAASFGMAQVDYLYEQPPHELFSGLLPKYVAIQLYRAMLESEAAEHAARMTAMDSATSNASDMIDALTLAMNRARQAKITKEIIEIVSGAAAQ